MRAGRMHHAWLITGPEGVGKATLAYRFARRLLAGQPGRDTLALDPAHPVFRRVAAGVHADLLTIERAYDEKTQAHAHADRGRRRAQDQQLHAPDPGRRRLARRRGRRRRGPEPNSANALLKVLEEPPPRAVLLLVCSAPGRLLPTIRCRCRRLRLVRPAASRRWTGCCAHYLRT